MSEGPIFTTDTTEEPGGETPKPELPFGWMFFTSGLLAALVILAFFLFLTTQDRNAAQAEAADLRMKLEEAQSAQRTCQSKNIELMVRNGQAAAQLNEAAGYLQACAQHGVWVIPSPKLRRDLGSLPKLPPHGDLPQQ